MDPKMNTSITLQLRHMKYINQKPDNQKDGAGSAGSSIPTNKPLGTIFLPLKGDPTRKLTLTQSPQANITNPGSSHQKESNSTKVERIQQSSKNVDSLSSVLATKSDTIRCFTCETDVGLQTRWKHLFFGHLQCASCCVKLKDCHEFSNSFGNKEMKCKFNKNGHSFELWLENIEEYLAYQIRKDLKIKTYISNEQFNISYEDISNSIKKYVERFNSLKNVSPWKYAIKKYYEGLASGKNNSSAVHPTSTLAAPNVTKCPERRVYTNKRLDAKQSTPSALMCSSSTSDNTEKKSGISSKNSQKLDDNIGLSKTCVTSQAGDRSSLKSEINLPSELPTEAARVTASKSSACSTKPESVADSKDSNPSSLQSQPVAKLKNENLPTSDQKTSPASDPTVHDDINSVVLENKSTMLIIINPKPCVDPSTRQTRNTKLTSSPTTASAKENTSSSVNTRKSVSRDQGSTTTVSSNSSADSAGKSPSTRKTTGVVNTSANAVPKLPYTRASAKMRADTAPAKTNSVNLPANTKAVSAKTNEETTGKTDDNMARTVTSTPGNTSDKASPSTSGISPESSAITPNSDTSQGIFVMAAGQSCMKATKIKFIGKDEGRKVLLNKNVQPEKASETQAKGISDSNRIKKFKLVPFIKCGAGEKVEPKNDAAVMDKDFENFVGFEDISIVSASTSKTTSALSGEVTRTPASQTSGDSEANSSLASQISGDGEADIPLASQTSDGEAASPLTSQTLGYCEAASSPALQTSGDGEATDETSGNKDSEVKENQNNIECSIVLRNTKARKHKLMENVEKVNKKQKLSENEKYDFIPRGVKASGKFLIVRHPQLLPHECPNCYCKIDCKMVKVDCSYFIINYKCPDCMLTIYTIPKDDDRCRLRERVYS